MEPFRSVRGGGTRAWLAAAEASLLRSLVGQVMSLVEPEAPADGPGTEGPEPGEDAELAALEAMVHGPGADTPPEDGGRIQLTQDQALSWLKALNDVRLALGVRLGVTEEFEEQWSRLKPDDPQWSAFEVYAWLGAVQESLVQAMH